MRRTLVLITLVATATTLSVATAGAQGDSNAQFCNANWKISKIFAGLGSGGPDEQPTPEQFAAADAKLAPLLDDAEASIPAEIESAVTPGIALLRQGLETASQDPTLFEAGAQIDAWAYDNCDYQTVDVTATEYKFSGLPKNLDPGRTMFRLTNEGAELHEMVIFNIKTKTPLKKLLANEKRAEKESVFAGATFAEQDQAGYAYVQLKKGRHAAVCFVPVGATDPNAEPPEGPPHFHEGMFKEFQVA
jgi:hypothetical protein